MQPVLFPKLSNIFKKKTFKLSCVLVPISSLARKLGTKFASSIALNSNRLYSIRSMRAKKCRPISALFFHQLFINSFIHNKNFKLAESQTDMRRREGYPKCPKLSKHTNRSIEGFKLSPYPFYVKINI